MRSSRSRASEPNRGAFIDSSVLLDVFTEDPTWLTWSQARLVEAAERGALVLNAVVIAEVRHASRALKICARRCRR